MARRLDAAGATDVAIWPMIETPTAVFDVRAIAAHRIADDQLVPVQIPRLAMTNEQLDQVGDAIIGLYAQREKIEGTLDRNHRTRGAAAGDLEDLPDIQIRGGADPVERARDQIATPMYTANEAATRTNVHA